MPPLDLFPIVLFCHLLVLILIFSAGYGNGYLYNCPRSFTCGNIGTFHYPFTKAEQPDCGLLLIHGCDDDDHYSPKKIQLGRDETPIVLTGMVDQKTIALFDEDFHKRLQYHTCETLQNSYTLPSPSPLVSFYIKYNVTLFRCKRSLKIKPPKDYFHHNCSDYDVYYDSRASYPNEDARRLFSSCSVLQYPTKDLTDTKDILSFLSGQLVVEVVLSDDCDHCYNHREGQCQLDNNKKFYCDQASAAEPKKRTMLNLLLGLGIASSAAVALLLLLALNFTFRCLRKKNCTTGEMVIERFLKQHGSLPTTRYSYSQIKKVTDCFKVKLGEGGYGSIYKGKLRDGSVVAVKVLNEIKGTGEEFINEIASISRTSHVNIVTLVGFCFQGSKRALIYEFMPNGSLEKFICEETPMLVGQQLACKTLYDIAIGVARGLDYLHRGCNTKILHFDIKPHNILLDEDFCPKISDFGLAKICPRKESIVSMLGARGTIGYIAPEVFCRTFGGVSHKSDVYSYGMLVLEMVGGRQNKNVELDCSSEIYFPHWIYKKLELNQEFGLRCIENESDRVIVRKMITVSLWCIQTDPLARPSMSKVVEMIEGSHESLKVPPKPFLRSPAHYSSESTQISEIL